MKLKVMLEKLTVNWGVLTVCFVIALIMHVSRQGMLFSHKTFAVPLAVISGGVLCPIEKYPDYVRITVRTGTDRIAAISENAITASLDLHRYTEPGTYTVPVSLAVTPELMAIEPLEITVHPESVPLHLEKKKEAYLTVSPSIAGTPFRGYTLTDVTATPAVVLVTGPQTIVDALAGVATTAVDVTGVRESGTATVTLVNRNPLVMIDAGVNVQVAYTVVPTPLSRHFEAVPVHTVFLPDTLMLAAAIAPVSFDLDGTELTLARYDAAVNTVQVDCSTITAPGSYELPIQFVLPRGVVVSNRSTDTVTVTVVWSAAADETDDGGVDGER
ncbi:MAG: YbbR-like domain-containing protein [Treponema sp.]|nr:YbbR-like domain-containing protein [Treponema sp.]